MRMVFKLLITRHCCRVQTSSSWKQSATPAGLRILALYETSQVLQRSAVCTQMLKAGAPLRKVAVQLGIDITNRRWAGSIEEAYNTWLKPFVMPRK